MNGRDGAEPPSEPAWSRYSARPFPPYRFVPGNNPHPRRHPQGHSFGCPEPRPDPCRPDDWRQSEDYRFGIDLYNFAYWWECHEVFEGFWHAVGPKTEQGQFFQALIQLAAANLKHEIGNEAATQSLLQKAARRFSDLPHWYMGINIAGLQATLQHSISARQLCATQLALE